MTNGRILGLPPAGAPDLSGSTGYGGALSRINPAFRQQYQDAPMTNQFHSAPVLHFTFHVSRFTSGILSFLTAFTLSSAPALSAQLTLKAVNKASVGRASQTIEVRTKDLASLGDPQKIHVKDANGQEILCQAVDTDFDSHRKPDILIFQAD